MPEKNIIRNDSGLVIGIKMLDNFGNLMEGIDPNAPIGQDDETIQTRSLDQLTPKEEEKKDDDRPPNVIGGGGPRPYVP